MRSVLFCLLCGTLLAAAERGAAPACNFGNGVAVSQPRADPNNLTCSPAHPAGIGTISLEARAPSDAYLDAKLFYFVPKPPPSKGRPNVVRIATLGLGGDGGCARGSNKCPGCPPNYPGKPTTHEEGIQRIMDYLDEAGQQGVDLAVLPENAFGRPGEPDYCTHPAEPIDGWAVTSVQALAKKHSMNIVLPLHESRADGRMYNTAVVIARNGTVVGHYSKVFPVFGNTSQTVPPTAHGSGEVSPPALVTPSSEGVRTFDLDFGRIAVLICYDINFAELWLQAEAGGAELVVWPSAMQTPDPSSYGYARIFQYDVISVGFPGDVVDRTGTQHVVRPGPPGFPMMRLADINIDRTFVHFDYNRAKVEKLLAENPSVSIEVDGPPFWLLASNDSSVSVRQLCERYSIETNRQYVHRSRQGLNKMRHTQVPPSSSLS
jgi:hypothetical protein